MTGTPFSRIAASPREGAWAPAYPGWCWIVFARCSVYLLSGLVETTEEKLVIAMFMTFIGLLFTGLSGGLGTGRCGVVLFCGVAYLFDNGMMNCGPGSESTLYRASTT